MFLYIVVNYDSITIYNKNKKKNHTAQLLVTRALAAPAANSITLPLRTVTAYPAYDYTLGSKTIF